MTGASSKIRLKVGDLLIQILVGLHCALLGLFLVLGLS